MLRQEAGKSRKQKRTVKQLHADLAALGYDGSYNRIAGAFARDWKAARQREQKTTGRGVFVPLAFLPGEAFQFDWSEDWAVIAGERTKLQVAHFKLSYSRVFILRAYPQQTHEILDSHNHAFRILGGVRGAASSTICEPRSTRSAALRSARSTRGSRRWSATSCSKPSSATRRPAGRKGNREERPGCSPSALAAQPSFPSLAALNDWLETRCRELWAQTPHGSHPGVISDAWSEEAQRLMQLPRLFDGFVEYATRVSPTCLIHLDRNRYSVPASFANRPVSVRVYPERIVVAAEGQIICEHRRVFARSHEERFPRRFRLAALSGGHSTQTRSPA